MARKIKIGLGNQERDGEEVAVLHSNEFWNTYMLEDGTEIRLKVVVKQIVKVQDAYDPEGNPVYAVKSMNVTDIISPPGLRKKGSK